jgi:ATPase family associated with various cellular activities (AAA)
MAALPEGLEPADLFRLSRRGIRTVVSAARKPVDPPSVDQMLVEFLGPEAPGWPVVGEEWPSYDHVNVQAAMDAWLDADGRAHRLVGLTQFQHRLLSLGDLCQPADPRLGGGPRMGSVSLTQLPAGPDGEVRSCVRCGLYLVTEADGTRLALLLFEGQDHGNGAKIHVEALGRDSGRAAAALGELRELAVRHSVFRGHVLTFSTEMFGRRREVLSFQPRPAVERDALILPDGVVDLIERQVLGVARYRDRLRASGQHLKRGLLLYGPPGTGKTHTVRYLLGRLTGVTVVVLSGNALQSIAAACSLARALQPSAVVVEDVDLIAEQRGMHPGGHPLLFQLLNEMDGLGEDVDVAFVLTTNRADLLEPALAARPGRVDQAVEIPLPDADARRRLLDVYRGNLVLAVADLDTVVVQTEGVTASFLKEVLRRATLLAADHSDSRAVDDALVVGHEPLNAALDELLDDRARLTRVILGG